MLEYEEANAAQLTTLRKERDVLEDELRQQVKGMRGRAAGCHSVQGRGACGSSMASNSSPLASCGSQVSAAKRNMEDSSAIAEREVAEMRRKALEAAEEEARLWAEVQKVSIRQKKLDEAMEQVRATYRIWTRFYHEGKPVLSFFKILSSFSCA